MNAPKSFFHHEPKIRTQAQMVETLKARTAARSAQQKLSWAKPVSNPDGTGYQLAEGTDYVLRKTLPEGKVMYWAWWNRKLLGYSPDREMARAHCEAHSLEAAK